MCLYFNRENLPSCYLVKIDYKLPNRLFTIWCDKIKIVKMDKKASILYDFIISQSRVWHLSGCKNM